MLRMSRVEPAPAPDVGGGVFSEDTQESNWPPLPLEVQLRSLPVKPGVYVLKDSQGHVLYVGKAGSLRSRVRAHFGPSGDLTAKEQRMQGRITDVEFIVTDSEQQALILENTLIKKSHPRYNVRLKDDKTFPYLRIDTREAWPRVRITRRWQKDGARYFGPFASAGSVRETLKLLKRLFPFASCKRDITGKDARPCLEYHIRRCVAPCIGKVTKDVYAGVIRDVILFLEGRQELVLRDLRRKMASASGGLQFERAAWLRDQIRAVESVIEGQRLASAVRGEVDVIALAQWGDLANVQVFFIRNSRLVGREQFTVEGAQDEAPAQVMASFVKQYYSSAPSIPRLVLLQHAVDGAEVVAQWLGAERGGAVTLLTPRRGARRQLMEVVAENARQGLEVLKTKQLSNSQAVAAAMSELQEKLALTGMPMRIECYDISNIQGALAVGSMVVFENGLPKPAHYRRFRIKTVSGANDYAMLQEVLKRRFARGASAEGSWAVTPDLVLIDGGKGQLNAALQAMAEMDVLVPAAGLAKEREEVFLPGAAEPLVMPPGSPARRLLQRVRDEAHRFAIGYHRKLRRREGVTSALDGVLGVGAKRRRELIRKFGSLRGVKQASVEELVKVPGISARLAETIKAHLGG